MNKVVKLHRLNRKSHYMFQYGDITNERKREASKDIRYSLSRIHLTSHISFEVTHEDYIKKLLDGSNK